MRIDAIIEATVTNRAGSLSISSLDDSDYRIEFDVNGTSHHPFAVVSPNCLHIVCSMLESDGNPEPIDFPASDGMSRLYVKPDGKLVEIAASVSDENHHIDWVDATVKREELREAISDVLAMS